MVLLGCTRFSLAASASALLAGRCCLSASCSCKAWTCACLRASLAIGTRTPEEDGIHLEDFDLLALRVEQSVKDMVNCLGTGKAFDIVWKGGLFVERYPR